jgi:hypothetical protein
MKKLFLAFAFIGLTVVGCTVGEAQNPRETALVEEQKDLENQRVRFADGLLELQFPSGWYENESEHPYDLQYFSKNQSMVSGIFLYKLEDLAADSTPQRMLAWHIDDLKSKRKNFTVKEPEQTESLGEKTITTVVYSGDKDSSRYYYKFTLVEFPENPEQFLVVLQVALPSQWSESKPILEEITRSVTFSSTRM